MKLLYEKELIDHCTNEHCRRPKEGLLIFPSLRLACCPVSKTKPDICKTKRHSSQPPSTATSKFYFWRPIVLEATSRLCSSLLRICLLPLYFSDVRDCISLYLFFYRKALAPSNDDLFSRFLALGLLVTFSLSRGRPHSVEGGREGEGWHTIRFDALALRQARRERT